jgi:membrane protein DedA with SNARE-associated domain
MRYLRYMVLGFIAISLIAVALANRGIVRLTLLPDALGELIGFNVQMQVPLFVVIFLGVTLGLLIGFAVGVVAGDEAPKRRAQRAYAGRALGAGGEQIEGNLSR